MYRWPVVAVLSDRAIVKISDAKTLDMRDEYWRLMEEMLPVLQPLQIVTALLSAEKTPSASLVYPMMFKLTTSDLAGKEDDSATVRDLKRDLRKALDERFLLSAKETAKHPFVTATVLDPVTKTCALFPERLRTDAYAHVRKLVENEDRLLSEAQQSPDDDESSASASPPAKRLKTEGDSRAAAMQFLSANLTTDASTSMHEFDRYLAAPVSDTTDALQFWASNACHYQATARVARQYLSIPAMSAQSERQFSAAGRLITKLRSRLSTDRVDTMIFLYKNMV